MKISQKLEYACRALVQLAKHFDGSSVMRLEEISTQEKVSSPFLVQIFNDLRKDGIVISKRGKMGGYTLKKPPATILLYDIVKSIEPTLLDESISKEGVSGSNISRVWNKLSDTFSNELKKITLSDLAENPDDAAMFYI